MIGLAFGAVYYFVFSRAIVKFNLPTLGRYAKEISADKTSGGNDFAKKILAGVGGTENLVDVGNCATRFKLSLARRSNL